MNNLDNYLEKFKSAMSAMGAEKNAVTEELFKSLGVRVSKEFISIKKDTIFISGSGSLKSQIFMKKKQILETLHKHNELKDIVDIR